MNKKKSIAIVTDNRINAKVSKSISNDLKSVFMESVHFNYYYFKEKIKELTAST